MNKTFIVLLFIAVCFQFSTCYPSEEREDASEFLTEKRELEALKRLLYTGKEQRREAKENYEEKCERNVLNKALSKERWCPELETWPLWVETANSDGRKIG